MSKNILYPYPQLYGEMAMSIKSVDVDGVLLPGKYINSDAHVVDLTDASKDWQTASLTVSIKCPNDILDKSRPWSGSTQVIATLHCPYSNGRQSVKLEQDVTNPTVWTGDLQVEKDFWYQRGTLTGIALAVVGGVPSRIIGETAPWTIGFDPISPIIQTAGALPVNWIDFKDPSEDGLEFLKQRFSADPWFIYLDPHNPRLLLNTSVEGLYALLSDEPGMSLAQKAAKQLIEGEIAAKVWDAFFAAAIATVEVNEETGEPIEPQEEWQAIVLRILLRRMYPEHDHADALKEALQSLKGDSASGLQQLIAVASDQQAKVPGALRAAARLLVEN
jgi:hypothetical protein